MTLDELTLEIDPPGSDRMLVGILKGKRMCSAPTMFDELERLAGRAGTASPAGGRSRSSGTPAGTPPVSRTAGADAPDLLGLLAGLLGTTHERLAGDPTLYRAQVERVRTAAARWREVMADPHGEPASRDPAEAELRAIFTATAEHTTATADDPVWRSRRHRASPRGGCRSRCRRPCAPSPSGSSSEHLPPAKLLIG
jgi:hypothetical protein